MTASPLNELSTVPVSTLVGAADSTSSSAVSPPSRLPSTVPPLTSGGKPEIVYMGAALAHLTGGANPTSEAAQAVAAPAAIPDSRPPGRRPRRRLLHGHDHVITVLLFAAVAFGTAATGPSLEEEVEVLEPEDATCKTSPVP